MPVTERHERDYKNQIVKVFVYPKQNKKQDRRSLYLYKCS